MKKILKISALIALVAVLGIALIACVPASINGANKKMSKQGYTVTTYEDKEADGMNGGIFAVKGTSVLFAAHFSSSKKAKGYYSDKVDDEKKAQENNYKQRGKWVYWGSEDAIKIFEK